MNCTIKYPKRKGVKPGCPLVYIGSLHLLINSLDNLLKNLMENDFYHLSHKYNANVIYLVKKMFFSL